MKDQAVSTESPIDLGTDNDATAAMVLAIHDLGPVPHLPINEIPEVQAAVESTLMDREKAIQIARTVECLARRQRRKLSGTPTLAHIKMKKFNSNETARPGVRPAMVMGQPNSSSARQGGPVARRAARTGSGSGESRKEIEIGARLHEKGDLSQALEPSPHCPGLSNPDLTPTSESE